MGLAAPVPPARRDRDRGKAVAREGDQRDRRRHPHQPRPGAAAGRGDPRRLPDFPGVFQPGVRPRLGGPLLPPRSRRGADPFAHGRRVGARRQQQRGRGAPLPRRAGQGPGGPGQPGGARRDRRLVPHSRHHGGKRGHPRGGGNDQPDAARGLRKGGDRPDGAAPEGPQVQFPHHGVHGGGFDAGSLHARRPVGDPGAGGPRLRGLVRLLRRGNHRDPDRPAGAPAGARHRDGQRRQVARGTPGGDHPGAQDARRALEETPPLPGIEDRQDVPGGAGRNVDAVRRRAQGGSADPGPRDDDGRGGFRARACPEAHPEGEEGGRRRADPFRRERPFFTGRRGDARRPPPHRLCRRLPPGRPRRGDGGEAPGREAPGGCADRKGATAPGHADGP